MFVRFVATSVKDADGSATAYSFWVGCADGGILPAPKTPSSSGGVIRSCAPYLQFLGPGRDAQRN